MKKLLSAVKIITLVVCSLLTLSFGITMITGIVNHGNVIGIIICLAVIIGIIFYPKYKKITAIRRISYVLAGLFAVAAVYTVVISSFMFSGMMNTPDYAIETGTEGAKEPHTVIVLGCKTINGVPSIMLAARLDKAAEYLMENENAVCIVTGGQGGDEIEPEAETMERYLITKGIDKERIYKEDISENTTENILFAKDIIYEQNLPEQVVIISECYHVYRGVRQAKLAGLDASAVAADINPVTAYTLPSYWLREIFAISRDLILG
ncbi:MAG: YdcF family protein [Ruminiclostridium sp.]